MNSMNHTTEAKQAAKAYLVAKSNFEKAYIRHWASVQPCNDTMGFRLLHLFQQQVQTYVFDHNRGADPGLKYAANEMYRLIAVGKASYTLEELNGFVVWYAELKARIGRAIDGLFEFHGDGFGDLCDSLPLGGKKIVQKCLATSPERLKRSGFLSEEEIEEAIEKTVGPQWVKLICKGENYIESTLDNQAKKWFLYNLTHDKAWFPEEEYHTYDYAFHGDED